MNLPAITIPVEIPDVIPALLHPSVVHFAIVVPLIILILELINLFMKRRSLTVSIYSLFVLVMIVFAAAYVTGSVDGKEAYPLLSADGQAELKAHKLLGTYLVYMTLIPVLFKILSVIVQKVWVKPLYLVLLAGFIALTLFQGKEGGELVYKYGTNVQAVTEAQDKAEEFEMEIEELQEKIEGLESALAESEKSIYDKSKEAVQKAVDAVTEHVTTSSEEHSPVDAAPEQQSTEHIPADTAEHHEPDVHAPAAESPPAASQPSDTPEHHTPSH